MKGYGILSFAKNMDENIDKNISKILNGANQSATDALKITSKKVIQKIANKIARTTSPNYPETFSQIEEISIEIPKEKYISTEKLQQIISDVRLI